MLRKKPSPFLLAPAQQKLRLLYARRRAIDTLIHSLEHYDRFRAKAVESRKRKTA